MYTGATRRWGVIELDNKAVWNEHILLLDLSHVNDGKSSLAAQEMVQQKLLEQHCCGNEYW